GGLDGVAVQGVGDDADEVHLVVLVRPGRCECPRAHFGCVGCAGPGQGLVYPVLGEQVVCLGEERLCFVLAGGGLGLGEQFAYAVGVLVGGHCGLLAVVRGRGGCPDPRGGLGGYRASASALATHGAAAACVSAGSSNSLVMRAAAWANSSKVVAGPRGLGSRRWRHEAAWMRW